jgi:RNA polymerase sigma-70 factor (ECF subfamily)
MNRAETFDHHRPLLLSIAYRMLGSGPDAEDMVQEAYLRWQGTAESEVESPRAYLSAVVTRLCIDRLKSAPVRHERLDVPLPADATAASDPFAASAMADSLSIAFVVLLQTLQPIERAVFLLHEVFDFDHAAIAAMVGRTEAGSRQILRRARARVAGRQPRFAGARADAERVTRQFFAAVRDGDLAGLMALLAEDVTFTADAGARYGRARAVERPLHGAATVARFLLAVQQQAPPAMHYTIGEVHGRPAILAYEDGSLRSVLALAVGDGRVRTIHVLSDPAVIAGLGVLRFAN